MASGAARLGREEFSESAVRRAVVRDTISHPLSVYPAVVGMLGGLAVALFGPTAALVWGASGALCLGFGSWLINFAFRRDALANAYLQRVHRALTREAESRLVALQAELTELNVPQGVEQLKDLAEKLANLKELLKRQLAEGELTYGRYLAIAEQVYLSGIDNLQQVAMALRSVRTIDVDELDARIAELKRRKTRTSQVAEEVESLEARRTLVVQQRAKVADLLAENERAMTQIDQTAAAIADMDTGTARASLDMETAMRELATLMRRAKDYSQPKEQTP